MDDAPLKASEATIRTRPGPGPAPAAGAETAPAGPGPCRGPATLLACRASLEAILDVREPDQAKTWKQRLVEALLNQAGRGQPAGHPGDLDPARGQARCPGRRERRPGGRQ